MSRSVIITEAKINRVLKAMVNNGIVVKEVDITADRVVLVTDSHPAHAQPKPSQQIKNWTSSPFDNHS